MVWNRLTYSRKLIGMALIACLVGYFLIDKGFSLLVFLGGFLILEHYLVWDRWDIYDYLLGHEYWGMYLITIGFLMNHYWIGLLVWVGFFLGGTYNKFNTWAEVIPTIRRFFNGK